MLHEIGKREIKVTSKRSWASKNSMGCSESIVFFKKWASEALSLLFQNETVCKNYSFSKNDWAMESQTWIY